MNPGKQWLLVPRTGRVAESRPGFRGTGPVARHHRRPWCGEDARQDAVKRECSFVSVRPRQPHRLCIAQRPDEPHCFPVVPEVRGLFVADGE